MITPESLDLFLTVMRKHNVMSMHMESGCDKVAVTLGPDAPMPVEPTPAPLPGGWKTQPSDPADPDPLGLGLLDAPIEFDEVEL